MKSILIGFLIFLSLSIEAQSNAIQRALKSYNYELAIQLITKEKKSAEMDFLKAKCYKNIGQLKPAIGIFEEIVKQDNSNLSAINELADCYQLTGDLSKSKFYYFMALQTEPNNRYMQLNYMNIVYKLRDWNSTISLADSILKKDSLPILYPILGDCYFQISKKDSAIFYYQKELKHIPEDYNTLNKLSRIYLQDNNYNELINCTERYIQSDSSNQQINQYNGIAYCMNKDYDKAIYRLNKLFLQGDSSFLTNYYLGASYLALTDYIPAFDHLSQSYQKDSTNLNLIYYLGRTSILIGHHADGIELLNRGLDLAIPKDSVLFNFYNNIALGYSRLFKYSESLKYYEICNKLKPDNKITLYTIAGIYDNHLNSPKQALKYYNLFIATFPIEPEKPKEVVENELSGTYYSAVKNRIEELKNNLFFDKK